MARSGSAVWRVFGWIWRIVTGVYRVLVIVIILVALGALWFDLRGGPTVHVGNHVALVLHPAGRLVDKGANPAERLIDRLSGEAPAQTSLATLRTALRHGARDPRIKLAVLDFDEMGSAGVAQLQELSRSIAAFRKAGKKVYAYGTAYNQYQYLPAVQADSISLDPMGTVLLQGFGVYGDYFKDALDKLGVQVEVFRVGAFKSAVEPFIRNDMSPDAKLANRAWLGDLWSSYQAEVVAQRKLAPDALDTYIANFSTKLVADQGNGAELALASKLVDKIQTRDQFRASMDALVGKDEASGSFRQISARQYERAWQHAHSANDELNRVGVIVVEGDIVDGKSGRNSAGGQTIAHLLDEATRSNKVAAVVLRVNSPGGSVVAAERIRRAEARLKAAGKPFVVSMSTLAASGGYWISMDADRIFAEPTTITGSIGIFALLPNFTQLLNKWGVHSDGVGTSPLAGAFRVDAPLTPPQRAIIQSQVDYGYSLFTRGVAQGRHLPLADVQTIAQGRVWSGEAAKQRGLVDAFGGLNAAIHYAAAQAKLKPGAYTVEHFTAMPSLSQLLKAQFHIHARSAVLSTSTGLPQAWLAPLVGAMQTLRHFNDPRGQYAYCFCRLAPATR
ncbi:MAG TPA: signal peptide peptidase SppA [Nevskiaceae bacterium]|nr:signal peptide peptidase SppA [Nevskiaceae bacterium]